MSNMDNPFDSQHHLKHPLQIETSPHIRSGASVNNIMLNVVYALLPAAGFAVYLFGLMALVNLLAATLTCLLTEHVLCRISGKATTVGDYSALITGLLFGLTLPPGLPLWMTVLGAVVAISLGKFLFGGLGYNAFNPALVGRAFLQAAFPTAMTTWSPALAVDRFSSLPSSLLAAPFTSPVYDGISSATPLASMKFDQQFAVSGELLLGLHAGSLGESGALLILLGGAWLAFRNVLNWRIPAAILLTVALLSSITHWLGPALPYLSRPDFHVVFGWFDAGRGIHGHRHGCFSDHSRRRGIVRCADRHSGSGDPTLGWPARGSNVRHSAGQCRFTPYR